MAALLLLGLAAVQGACAQLNQAAYLPLQSGDTPVAPGDSFYGTVSLIYFALGCLTPTRLSPPAQCS